MSELDTRRARVDELDYLLRCEDIKIKILSKSLKHARRKREENFSTRSSEFFALTSLPTKPSRLLQLPAETLTEIWDQVFRSYDPSQIWALGHHRGLTEFKRWFAKDVGAHRTSYAGLSRHLWYLDLTLPLNYFSPERVSKVLADSFTY